MDLIEIDDILLLILQRIDSPVSLVRAASTCKRWLGIISNSGFLRRFRSVHAPSLTAGDYFNDTNLIGAGPRFVPATSSSIDARHFSLDFLSDAYNNWAVLDSHGSLLLLSRRRSGQPCHGFPDIVVCEPAMRRYKRIPAPPYFHCCTYKGCYLIEGDDADMTGGRI
ncbi:unnamed protein product [Urochloa humidicola]